MQTACSLPERVPADVAIAPAGRVLLSRPVFHCPPLDEGLADVGSNATCRDGLLKGRKRLVDGKEESVVGEAKLEQGDPAAAACHHGQRTRGASDALTAAREDSVERTCARILLQAVCAQRTVGPRMAALYRRCF